MQQQSFPVFELSYIVPVYLQNNHSSALADIINLYSSYSKELVSKIEFIFIDDCSPVSIQLPETSLNYTLAKINTDIPWNQPGARNLGVQISRTSKLVLTDLDHIFSESLLSKIVGSPLPQKLYKFKRKQKGQLINSHPNTFYCTKSIFYKSLGYDESFCGHYGYDDSFFIAMQKALGTKIRYFTRRYFIEQTGDDNKLNDQHFLERDTSFNKALLLKKTTFLDNKKNIFAGHSRLHINFDYQVISRHFTP